MLNLLEFPPSSPAALKAPCVIFAIQGNNVSGSLPGRVPKSMVLHFAPEMAKWVLPSPTGNPHPSLNALPGDFVGLNILEPITVTGLCWILLKMLEASRIKIPTEGFTPQPGLKTCVEVLFAWHKLGLHAAGVDALRMHMLTRLMFGPGVRVQTMDLMWRAFTHDSGLVFQTAHNYIRHVIENDYTAQEMTGFRDWIGADDERRTFFRNMETHFPSFQNDIAATTADPTLTSHPRTNHSAEILEQTGTRRVTNRERRRREALDRDELTNRLHRTLSISSLRSAFDSQSPEPEPPSSNASHDSTISSLTARFRALSAGIAASAASATRLASGPTASLDQEARRRHRSSSGATQTEEATRDGVGADGEGYVRSTRGWVMAWGAGMLRLRRESQAREEDNEDMWQQ